MVIEVFEMTLKNLVVSRASTTVTAPALFWSEAKAEAAESPTLALARGTPKKFKIPIEKCKII